jgi:hypothetical protein
VADCLFCQIVSGLIPATTVMDSNRTLAFRDINTGPQAGQTVGQAHVLGGRALGWPPG